MELKNNLEIKNALIEAFQNHKKNKFKKNFYKIRTLFYQIFVKKIYPSKNIFRIANIFKSK